jgi:hypothetical protein
MSGPRSRLPLALLLVLSAGCRPPPAELPAPEPSAAPTQAPAAAPRLGAEQLAALRDSALDAFATRDFPALEALATRLRTEQPRTPEGGWALEFFYETFSPRRLELPAPEIEAIFAAWQDFVTVEANANPTPPGGLSATRAVAEAVYWRTQDGSAAKAGERTAWARARARALATPALTSACPQLAAERHRRLTSREADRASAEAIYAEAAAAHPGYGPLVEAHAGWLSGFAETEIGSWLAGVADAVGGAEGDELYAHVAASRPRSDHDWIARRNLDWERMRRGFASIAARWPGAAGTLDRLALSAENHGDVRSLREALQRLEAGPHQQSWSHNLGSYLRARRRAGLEAASDLTPIRETALSSRPYRVAFAPDGRTLLVGCARGELLAFATEDLTPLWELRISRWISALCFSPDGRFLAMGGGHVHDRGGGSLQIWQLDERRVVASDESLPGRILACAFSPDGVQLWAGGGDEGAGQLLRWRPGEKSFTRRRAPEGAIHALVATREHVLFSARRQIWRGAAGEEDTAPQILFANRAVHALALSPDTASLAAGGWQSNAAWNRPTGLWLDGVGPGAGAGDATATPGAPASRTVRGTRVEALAFSPDGGLLAAASSAADFSVWRLPETEPWLRAHIDDGWTIEDLAFSPDGGSVATVDTSGRLRVWALPPR